MGPSTLFSKVSLRLLSDQRVYYAFKKCLSLPFSPYTFPLCLSNPVSEVSVASMKHSYGLVVLIAQREALKILQFVFIAEKTL